MRNLVANITSLTNDADGIAETQTAAGAQALTLNGALVTSGVASWGFGQKVSITSVGNDTGITFTITGTDPDGTAISQAVTGANAGVAKSTAYFKTVSSVVTSGATAGAVTVGVLSADGGISRSLRVNGQQSDFKLGLFYIMSGASTATVEHTPDQPENSYAVSYSVSADWIATDGLTAVTANAESNIFYKVNAVRLKLTAYTSGTAKLTVTQSF